MDGQLQSRKRERQHTDGQQQEAAACAAEQARQAVPSAWAATRARGSSALLQTMHAAVQRLQQQVSRLQEKVEQGEQRVEELASRVGEVEETMEELKGQVDEGDQQVSPSVWATYACQHLACSLQCWKRKQNSTRVACAVHLREVAGLTHAIWEMVDGVM